MAVEDSAIVIKSVLGAELYRARATTTLRNSVVEAVDARANLEGAYLAGAYLARANLAGAYLARANLEGANLAGAYLAGAYLARANLEGANFQGANLAGAYLAGAYLARANLEGANFQGAKGIILGPMRSDGYLFLLAQSEGSTEWLVFAGCRNFTMKEARKHWKDTRAGTPLGDETFAILDYLDARLKQVQK